MIYYYNKLVRDKIVQNIKNKGSKVDFKVLNTEEYKIELAKLMIHIRNSCTGRFKGRLTLKEQEQYLSTLPKEALHEIEQQIEMYKTARQYYRQYLYRK